MNIHFLLVYSTVDAPFCCLHLGVILVHSGSYKKDTMDFVTKTTKLFLTVLEWGVEMRSSTLLIVLFLEEKFLNSMNKNNQTFLLPLTLSRACFQRPSSRQVHEVILVYFLLAAVLFAFHLFLNCVKTHII